MLSPSDSFDADNYDIPRKAVPVLSDRQQFQRASSRQSILSNSSTSTSLQLRMDETYDIPRPSSNLELKDESRMTPSSSNSSLLTSESLSLSLSSSNRSSLANMPDYDIPRKQLFKKNHLPTSQINYSSKSIGSENYDIPNNISPKKMIGAIKELPLELSSALDTLSRLQKEATTAITKLLSFVNPQWRHRQQVGFLKFVLNFLVNLNYFSARTSSDGS